jgi:hypothetical protein
MLWYVATYQGMTLERFLMYYPRLHVHTLLAWWGTPWPHQVLLLLRVTTYVSSYYYMCVRVLIYLSHITKLVEEFHRLIAAASSARRL